MHYTYPSVIRDIQKLLEKTLGFVPDASKEDKDKDTLMAFNHVMLNKYDNGDVYIGQHSDTRENKVEFLIWGSMKLAYFATGDCKY